MADSELVEDIGVVDRHVGDHQVRGQQKMEHVGANVPLLDDLTGRAAADTDRVERGRDEMFFDPVEVDTLLRAEGTDDESSHIGS